MKKHKKCNKCIFYQARAYTDMGAVNDGCKLFQYHKDYSIWHSLFDGKTDEPCTYYEPKEKIKDKIKRLLGDNFIDTDI